MTVNSENSPTARTIAAVQWFRAIMWLGIGANVACAFISMLWTEGVLNFLHLETAHPLIWPRFAAFLLVLLSIFYVPSAIDPLAHCYSAALAIICRFGGVAFFTIAGGRYIFFGLFDLAFRLPQAILLLLVLKSSNTIRSAR
jgi:hypothetical protein